MKKNKKIIGVVASSFDIFHPGHIMMLKDAKTMCTYLIALVQINPASERPDKNKPIQTIEERQIMLKGIKYVDEIYVYTTEEQLLGLLKVLNPDVRIMGTDWKGKQFTGYELNIPIYWHERNAHSFSTTSLRRRIWEEENKKG